MSRSRSTTIVLRIGLGILILSVVCGLFFVLEQKRTQAETGAILSAYLSDELLHDYHDWGSGRGVQVIVQREAQSPGNLRWRWTLLLDRRALFQDMARSSRISFFVTNMFPTDFKADLHLPNGAQSFFIGRKESDQTDLQAKFPKNFGLLAVSHIGLNLAKNEAIFYIDHFCGLCGGGSYVLMRKVNGVWRVIDQHSTWVS